MWNVFGFYDDYRAGPAGCLILMFYPVRYVFCMAEPLKTESLSIVIRRGEPKQQTIGRLFRISKSDGMEYPGIEPEP